MGRVESLRNWSSHLFRGQPGGRRHVRSGGRLSDVFSWSWRLHLRSLRVLPSKEITNLHLCIEFDFCAFRVVLRRRTLRCDSALHKSLQTLKLFP